MAEARFHVRITQAARLAGVHKTTVIRAIKSGKLSASIADDGTKRIDVSELQRVYGELRTGVETVARDGAHQVQSGAGVTPDQTDLVAELRRQIETAAQREAQLRRDIEAERDERRRLVAVIERQTLLLEHQPADRERRPTSLPRPKPTRPQKPRPEPATPTPTIGDLAGGLWNVLTRRR